MTKGLLENNYEQKIQSKVVYCQLLVVILLTDEVIKPYILWDQFKAKLYDGVKHKLHYMSHY